MVLRYIFSRFQRQAPNPTTINKAAKRAAAEMGSGAPAPSARMTGAAPPVNMARPASSPLASSSAAPSTSASSSLGSAQQPMRNSATQSSAQFTGSAGKGPRTVVDPNQPRHKQWMPDFQTVRSHPNVMAAITGGTAAGLGIFYYRRFATKEPAVSAQ